jgi:flagellin
MAGVTLGTNISSLLAQRSLKSASEDIGRVFERLSTGMRITRPSDDAAGLAIASGLSSNARVFSRGLLNINDGVSALSIAEGGLSESSSIATRLRELAVQAANGSLSTTQRRALDSEADLLVNEFNRITQTTSFNGLQLLSANFGNMRIQAGYGTSGGIDQQLNSQLSRNQGNATYSTASTTGGSYQQVQLSDLNGDGKLDLVSLNNAGFMVRLGNGDGTFGAGKANATAGSAYDKAVGDFNGDGKADVLVTFALTEHQVFFGNGDGTFRQGTQFSGAMAGTFNFGDTKDLNGDGKDDFVRTTGTDFETYLSNGDGSFKVSKIALTTSATLSTSLLGDFDGNGTYDALVTAANNGITYLLRGDGRGGFASPTIASDSGSFAWASGIDKGDFNGDGLLDYAVTTTQDGTIRVMLNQGNASFKQSASISFGGTGHTAVRTGDLNADGIDDLAFTDFYNQNSVSTSFGNGDGTFGSVSTYATGLLATHIAIGDLNNDGVNDISEGTWGGGTEIANLLSGTYRTTLLPTLNLNTRADALNAISVIDAFQQRVSSELGTIGAFQSRLSTAYNVLANQRDQYLGAESRITNADVAHETANLVRKQILLQAGASVIASANQQSALVLRLLGN